LKKRIDGNRYKIVKFSVEEVAEGLKKELKGEEGFLSNVEKLVLQMADDGLGLLLSERQTKKVVAFMINKGWLILPEDYRDSEAKAVFC